MKRLLLALFFVTLFVGWRFSFYIDTDRETKLTLGMEKGATDGFDKGVDQVAPPLPPEGSHSVFPLADKRYSFIDALWTDIRGFSENASWTITIANLEKPVRILWNPDSLPPGDLLYNDTLSLRQFPNGILPIGTTNQFKLVYHEKPIPTKIITQTKAQLIFSLDAPSPNPFNSTTNIMFSIPDDKTEITLTIMDMLGKPVRRLFSGKLDAGKYRMMWDGRNDELKELPSGLYFCQLKSANNMAIAKILFVK